MVCSSRVFPGDLSDPRHRRGTVCLLARCRPSPGRHRDTLRLPEPGGHRPMGSRRQPPRPPTRILPKGQARDRLSHAMHERTAHFLAALPAAKPSRAALTRWILAQGCVTDLERPGRGDRRQGPCGAPQGHRLPGVPPAGRLLAGTLEAVIAQLAVPGETNEHKTALEPAQAHPLEGNVDHRRRGLHAAGFLAAVVEGQGDYFLRVKDNQPTLQADIRAGVRPGFFLSGEEGNGGPPKTTGPRVRGKGHGRIEVRRLRATTRLTGYLDWPGMKRVCLLERDAAARGQAETTETVLQR